MRGDWIFDLYGACLTSAYNAAGGGSYAATDACARDLTARWDAWPEGKHRIVGVLVVGVIPIIVAWIFAWVCIRVTSWVRSTPLVEAHDVQTRRSLSDNHVFVIRRDRSTDDGVSPASVPRGKLAMPQRRLGRRPAP